MGNVKTTPCATTKSDVNSRPTSEENITKPIVLPKPVIRKEETQRWQLSERDIAFLCSQTGLKRKELDRSTFIFGLFSLVLGFTADEVVSWHKKFFDNNPNGRLDLDNFKKFYCHLQSEPIERLGDMCEHIFRAFDVDGNGVVEFGEFLLGFAICSRGDLRARLDYAFSCYDIGSNGYITESRVQMLIEN